MPGFDNNYNGGYNFNTTTGNARRKTPSENSVMYDDMSYDNSYAPPRGRVYNGRAGGAASSTGRAVKRGRQRADIDREEIYDDYRPGSRLMVEERLFDSYESFKRDKMGIDDFDDDDFGDAANMTDDFDSFPKRRRGPARPRPAMDDRRDIRGHNGHGHNSRMRSVRDYTDDDYYAEFGGIRGIYNADAPLTEKASRRHDGAVNYSTDNRYDRAEDYEDNDGYFGHATIRDKGFDGKRVPKFIDDFYRGDDGYYDGYDEYDQYGDRGRSGGRRRTRPIVQLSSKKSSVRNQHLHGITVFRLSHKATVALASVFAAVVVGIGIWYIGFLRTTSPLNVTTALTAMQDNVSNTLLRSSVDYQLASRTVQVTANGITSVMSLADCEFRYSTDADGSVRKEWGKSVSGSDVQYTYMTKGSISFNETKVKDFLHKASGVQGVRMIEPDYKVDIRQDRDTKVYTGTLTVTKGSDGYGVDFDSFINELLRHISNDDLSPIAVELTNTIAPSVDIDKIYNEVHTVASDSYRFTSGSGEVIYEPEVIGVDFDKRAASEKITSGGTEWVINLALTVPKVTRKELMAETFPDLLATYSTAFNANNQARSSNLALAGDYINNTTLQPGEVFSFNKQVGERTREHGFCKATVYSSEGTDEDYGGGICQTSSTLFYCAMKANLELVKRTNHLYTVNYMVNEKGEAQTYGNDATVNWGTVDMQFRNNKEYPIRIECITKNGVITFNIWGTWDGYTAEYRYSELDVKSYSTVYRKYKDGKKNQAGQLGRTIRTFRVVYYQEEPNVGERKEVDRYREFDSVYLPLSEIKYVNSPPAGREFDVAYSQ